MQLKEQNPVGRPEDIVCTLFKLREVSVPVPRKEKVETVLQTN